VDKVAFDSKRTDGALMDTHWLQIRFCGLLEFLV